MLTLAAKICRTTGYWFLLFLFAISLELIALYFQYQLGYGPCVLCVEIRAIVLGVALISLLGMLVCRYRVLANLMNIGLIGIGAFMYLKSDLLLKIENNEIESVCGFKPDFPQWLPLDIWLPSVFEAWEACGYTPEMWVDITMAQALIYCSIGIIALGVFALTANILFGKEKQDLQLFS